jgi:hypothetical protein
MSFYSQNYDEQQQQQYGASAGSGGAGSQNLHFLPTQFGSGSSYNASSQVGGTMSPQSQGQYSYGTDIHRERLSTGILAAFGTSGYPGEPPLLEGMLFEIN